MPVDYTDAGIGAYTHNRVRELILGGVNRDILLELELPVLMAH